MGLIRTLIVDDELRTRRSLRARLEREPDVKVVGEAANGPEAVEAILTLQPDLIFLDVEMPGLTGFQVLDHLSETHPPMVVFVTAYDVHALKAFEIDALDYLLKPFSDDRFDEALRRARRELTRGVVAPDPAKLAMLLTRLEQERGTPTPVYARGFAVREGDRIALVKTADLCAVEAAGNYVVLVNHEEKHLLRLSISEIEKQLDPNRFVRIHRSTIVSVERIAEIRTVSHGDCDVLLDGGAVYRMTRVYRDKLLSLYRGIGL